MTEEEFNNIQNDFVGFAQQMLLNLGGVRQLGAVITKKSNMDKLKGEEFSLEFLDSKDTFDGTLPDAADIVMVVDMSTDSDKLFSAVKQLYPRMASILDREFSRIKDRSMGRVNDSDIFDEIMTRFYNATGIMDKDITAGIVRMICQKVDATAAIILSEAWMISYEGRREDYPKNLADAEDSIEVIFCSMDTPEFRRMITIPVLRSESEITFGEVVESVDRKDGENTHAGRFVDILAPISKGSA